MSSHALNWLVKQYRCVLGRLRVREYLQSRPTIAWASGSSGVVEGLEHRVMLTGATINLHKPAWVEQGPGTVTGTSTGSRIPTTGGVAANPAVGAIQAIATLPNSADIIYVAAANGGIWRSLDATN